MESHSFRISTYKICVRLEGIASLGRVLTACSGVGGADLHRIIFIPQLEMTMAIIEEQKKKEEEAKKKNGGEVKYNKRLSRRRVRK